MNDNVITTIVIYCLGEHSALVRMDHVISMEQSPLKKFERTNAGEPSRGHDQSVNLNEVIQNQSVTVNEEVSINRALQCKLS